MATLKNVLNNWTLIFQSRFISNLNNLLQGKFLQCRNEGNQIVHNFHEACQVIKDGKNYCPHCGETSEQVEVSLMLQEKKPPTVESKSSRIQ